MADGAGEENAIEGTLSEAWLCWSCRRPREGPGRGVISSSEEKVGSLPPGLYLWTLDCSVCISVNSVVSGWGNDIDGGAKSCSVGSSGSDGCSCRCASLATGDVVFEGGRGMNRAGMGDAEAARDIGIGEAVADRGNGIADAGMGETG